MLHDSMATVVQLRERVELNGNQARQLILRYLLVKWLAIEFYNSSRSSNAPGNTIHPGISKIQHRHGSLEDAGAARRR